MIYFITNNKKVLLLTWGSTAIPLTSMIFCAMPYIKGPALNTADKIIVFLIFAAGLPFFVWSIMFIVWLVDLHKFKKNLQYEPFKVFFEKHNFEIQWIDSEYLRVVAKGMFGTLRNKRIVCRINVSSLDVLDFIIYDLDAEKINKKWQSSYKANTFDLEEPRFFDGLVCKSFYRTKKLTAEKVTSELEALIIRYE